MAGLNRCRRRHSGAKKLARKGSSADLRDRVREGYASEERGKEDCDVCELHVDDLVGFLVDANDGCAEAFYTSLTVDFIIGSVLSARLMIFPM